MSGSALAPIIIPIVVVPVLAIWLIMVYYADSHPLWQGRGQSPARRPPTAVEARVPGTDPVVPPWPGGRSITVPSQADGEDRSSAGRPTVADQAALSARFNPARTTPIRL